MPILQLFVAVLIIGVLALLMRWASRR